MSNGFRSSTGISVELTSQEKGVECYLIKAEKNIDNIRIEWTEPMASHYGVWHPMCGRWRQMSQWFCAQKTEACFYKGAPVLATFTADGKNKTCVSIKDTVSPSSIGFYVDDFNGNYEVVFSVNIDVNEPGYTTVLRIDRSDILFSDAIHNVALWWNETIVKAVPDDAYAPLYSSWYNFHQNPDQNQLTSELKAASELGFKIFILDDGWQIDGAGTKDYLLSGDWKVSGTKFPDFRRFVNDIHSFGMKCMVWFAVPFAGYQTEAYSRFRGKLLYEEDGYLNAGILDIRYPEVREYIIETYRTFIRKYDIDGMKLDFIDSFKCYKNTPDFNAEMDCKTVEKAVTVLLEEIRDAVNAEKDGFLFEYRQFYVGPSILEFGNMVRVADCAFDSVTNRIGVADLRMVTDKTAVHSDMLMWSPVETPVNCAMQLLNVMFSAVQVSVLLNESTDEQKRVIKAFINYSYENREVLLKGYFKAFHPELNYTVLSSESMDKSKKISVLYANEPYEYSGKTEDVWNGCFAEELVVLNKKSQDLKITIKDFLGQDIDVFTSNEGTFMVKVPPTGMVRIERNY